MLSLFLSFHLTNKDDKLSFMFFLHVPLYLNLLSVSALEDDKELSRNGQRLEQITIFHERRKERLICEDNENRCSTKSLKEKREMKTARKSDITGRI